jgi:3-hydroxy-9,10-secoandrosta-1,3,5(10)-triene-9,17-dione monooxygenase reductase component
VNDRAGSIQVSATDPKQVRNALGAFATGVTIITTSDGGKDVGLTANSFNSVSLNPPMVLWSLGRSSFSLPVFERATHFAVHVLAEDQEDLSTRFATRSGDKFQGLPVTRGEAHLPLLSDCTARFQCKKVFAYEGGDHVIFVGEVTAFDHEPKRPLLFHGGRYAVTKPLRPAMESLGEGEDSLSWLITRASVALRRASLQHAEALGLSQPERYLLTLPLDSAKRGIDEVNDILSYTGLQVTGEIVDGLRQRGLVAVADASGGLSLTPAGRECAVAIIAITSARSAEAEIQLGAEAVVLKELLKRLIANSDASNDARGGRHMELMKNMEVASR